MWSRHWFSCEIVTSLNEHVHFHVCVVDGVFKAVAGEEGVCDGVIFHPATGVYRDTVAQVQASLRLPLQRAFVGRGLLEGFEAQEMLAYLHSGFSADTSVCIAAHDRAGLERLLRYCARPPFALARLRKAVPGRVHPARRACTSQRTLAPPACGGCGSAYNTASKSRLCAVQPTMAPCARTMARVAALNAGK